MPDRTDSAASKRHESLCAEAAYQAKIVHDVRQVLSEWSLRRSDPEAALRDIAALVGYYLASVGSLLERAQRDAQDYVDGGDEASAVRVWERFGRGDYDAKSDSVSGGPDATTTYVAERWPNHGILMHFWDGVGDPYPPNVRARIEASVDEALNAMGFKRVGEGE